jgi:IS30 family transposase
MRVRRRKRAGVEAEKQQRYVQLIAQGVNNSEACRLVGIHRKTGNRWRYGRRVRDSAGALVIYAPVKINETRPRSPRYLSEPERIQIADLLAARTSLRAIAEQLGRAPSTISREIRRNRDPDERYRPHHADHAARCRAGKPRQRRVAVDKALAEVVQRLLAKRWSLEQVAHELRVLFLGQPSRWLCEETIYQAIYDTAVSVTRPVRRRRLQGLQRRGRLTAMRMIDERPAEVNDRELQARPAGRRRFLIVATTKTSDELAAVREAVAVDQLAPDRAALDLQEIPAQPRSSASVRGGHVVATFGVEPGE